MKWLESESVKLGVLILCTLYIGFVIVMYALGKPIETPAWIVSLITMAYIFFFRKSGPKKNGDNNVKTNT